MKILINEFSDIRTFVQTCSNCYEGDVYATQGRQTVNAKSIMGLFSLDLAEPIYVTVETSDNAMKEEFQRFISRWEVCEEE